MLPAGHRETDSGDISCATILQLSKGSWASTGEFKNYKDFEKYFAQPSSVLHYVGPRTTSIFCIYIYFSSVARNGSVTNFNLMFRAPQKIPQKSCPLGLPPTVHQCRWRISPPQATSMCQSSPSYPTLAAFSGPHTSNSTMAAMSIASHDNA